MAEEKVQPTKLVHKIEDGMDVQEILATTYQMRNFYSQLRDGYFTVLDTMNYIQHHAVTRLCKKDDRILDVCCGRGLMLPLLRYYKKNIKSYTGIDIEPKNAIFTQKIVTNNKELPEDYYPFEVNFVEGNVAFANKLLEGNQYDIIIYTSSIEHMHKSMGARSLFALKPLLAPDGVLIITCPNTPENQSGYDTQYAAHVYEWKASELRAILSQAGFKIYREFGLLSNKQDLRTAMDIQGYSELLEKIEAIIPSDWFIPVLSAAFPEISKEIGMLCQHNNF